MAEGGRLREGQDRQIRIRDTLEPGWQERDSPLEVTLGHEEYVEMIGFIGNDVTTGEEYIVIANRDQANEIQSHLDDRHYSIATTPWNRYMKKIDGEKP